MALQVINGPIIAAGESLSEGVDCSGGNAVRITMPAGWSGGNLTFAISTDGNGYNDLFDAEGQEITLKVTTGAAVRIEKDWATFWNFIKFRAGTRSHPVVQEEQRDFAITLSEAPATAGAQAERQPPQSPQPPQPPQPPRQPGTPLRR
jgi:hypothetical protein